MKRDQVIHQLRKAAKANGLELSVARNKANGSHYTLLCGTRRTIIKSGEITPKMEQIIRRQLGL